MGEFAELNQGPPAASVAPNAVKMSLNGEAGEYSMMAGPKRTEERQNPKTQKPKISTQDITGKDRKATMKDLKANVSEISEKLFSFENEVKGNFMEKNLTSAQEEEMMMVLGKKGAMLEKKAKRLHEIFEDMEKSGKENKEDVKVMKGKFEEFKNMMEEVVGMGQKRWNKVQAHKEESDNKEKKPEGKGKDTKERKPEGKGKETKEKKQRKPEGKEKKQRRERKPLGKDKKQRRERREGKGKGKGKGKDHKEDTRERKPEKEDHIAFDDIKEQFSKIFEKLSAVKKEAKQLFSKKDISEDEQ